MEQPGSILFIDIETVPIRSTYGQLPEGLQAEWDRKARTIRQQPDVTVTPDVMYNERAGIYSEFAKIVCISVGSIVAEADGEWKIRLRSLTKDNEAELLTEFSALLERMTARYRDIRFCGHNIKEFDIPFICRRFIINGLSLPPCLQLSGRKPWEITHIDTMELWKFGDNKNFTALSLLAQVLGIPSPKSDMDGSQVGRVYWEEHDLTRIAAYCVQDVLTVAKVYLRLKGMNVELTPVYLDTQQG